ncbi:hypothetical protein BGX34_011014 [Mortierella sp. NVP85]|nr:hypothetical protein BGX34_011014 [Mortierella sp. NVP85]
MFGTVVPSKLGYLSPQQALNLANLYLRNAKTEANLHLRNAKTEGDPAIALVLCHEVEVSLSQAKKAAKNENNQAIRNEIGFTFIELSRLLEKLDQQHEANVIRKKGRNLWKSAGESKDSSISNTAVLPAYIFAENVHPPSREFKLPEPDERLNDTLQLAGCLGLLRTDLTIEDGKLEPAAHDWWRAIEKDEDERIRLETMATEVIRIFKGDKLKDPKAIAEVIYLTPVLTKDTFKELLNEFITGIRGSELILLHQLQGLTLLIQGADPNFLSADDLIKILERLSDRLMNTHQQSPQSPQSSEPMYQLTLAVSHVLDAMVDTKVTGVDRAKLHDPLSKFLDDLKKSSDPLLIFQAAYAYQALLYVPDNETKWQSAMRRTSKVVQGLSKLVSGVKGLDLEKLIEGLGEIKEEAYKGVEVTMKAYENVTKLVESGNDFLESLKEGFSFKQQRKWYPALRGAEALIRDGELATFKELVCNAPCRLDPAFQWGVCKCLGQIAADLRWDPNLRRGAIGFLVEIYREDTVWGKHTNIKKWILNILMQLGSPSEKSLKRKCVLGTTVSWLL